MTNVTIIIKIRGQCNLFFITY